MTHPFSLARRARGSRGFSTLELVVVVVVVGIITAAGIPALLTTIQRYRTRAGAELVTTDLRRAQSLAMTSGASHRLMVQDCLSGPTPCKRYRIERQTSGTTWPAIMDSTGNNSNVLQDWLDLQSVHSGVRITSLTDSGGSAVTNAAFNSLGASTNGEVTITVTHTSGVQRTIQIRSAGSVRMP